MELATRAAYRGQLTKIVKAASEYLNSADSQVDNEENFDGIEEELLMYLQRLQAVNDSLNTVNCKVMEKDLIKTDLEQEMTKIAEYEDSATTAISRLNTRLRKLTEKSRPSPTTMDAERTLNPRPNQSHISLPKLALKKFDGNVKDWLPFWEQFRLSVHENVSLSSTEKFNYLESCLLGSAKKVVAGFTASENCYDAAISLLKEQYGDDERLVDSHIQQLVSLRPVHSSSDVHGLRNLYNAITTCRRSLTALNVPSNQYDVMLKSILLRCLPVELRIDYHRIKDRDEYHNNSKKMEEVDEKCTSLRESSTSTASAMGHVQRLMEFLRTEVEAIERSKVSISSAPSHIKANSSTISTAASLVALNENSKCVFCLSVSHLTNDCNSNLTLVQKRDILAKNGRCFRCAKKGHRSNKCRSVKWIKCKKCNGNHMTAMCDPKFEKTASLAVTQSLIDMQQVQKSERDESVSSNLMCNSHGAYTNVFLKTARCIGEGQRQSDNLLLRIVIDGGSQTTYICETVAKKLDLIEIGQVKMTVVPFGATSNSPQQILKKVRIRLRSQYDHQTVDIEALIVPQICADLLDSPHETCYAFANIRLADKIYVGNVAVEHGLSILIGADYYWDVVSGKQRRIAERLKAVETLFGWTIQGRHDHLGAKPAGNSAALFVSMGSSSVDEQFTNNLASMWALESIGIQGEEKEKISLTETLTQKCIQRIGTRYQASLPWKDDDSSFCADKKLAIARLNSLVRRLSTDPNKLLEYDAAIHKMLKEGIAELVSEHQLSSRTFYLPHHPVYKEDSKTTRTRIVFDASFQTEDHPSLNSFLETVVADIEKAFLQILLAANDRDSHRFVWFLSIKDRRYQVFRMTRVTFGVNSSPFLLTAVIQKHLEEMKQKFPGTCKSLKKAFYMDDLVLSCDTEEEALTIYRESNEIMKEASMSLQKWNSNSKKVREMFKDEELVACQKVLGLVWHVSSDELQVPLRSLHSLQLKADSGTKRSVLQAIARIYDPLGIIAPTVIRLKIFFQSIWKRKLGWTDAIPLDLLPEWNQVISGILELEDMTIPRSALSITGTHITVHIFADASLRAFGAVAYIKCVSPEGVCRVSFLCAKSRVAPLKENNDGELTLPKLELTANLVAARLSAYIKRILKVTVRRFFLWSDSKIALNWIYGENKRWKPYVQSRVTEIRSLTRLIDWGHCSGKENPADLITRGIPGSKLQTSCIWLNGPDWLSELPDDRDNSFCANFPVLKSQTILLAEANVNTAKLRDPILNFEDFGTWKELLRRTVLIQRIFKAWYTKTNTNCRQSTTEELNSAEDYWVKYAQHIAFTNEIHLLYKGQLLPGKSPIAQLCPFLDEEGFLRLGGRQQLLDDAFDVKHPKVLSPNSHITKLIVEDYHLRTMHAGVGTLLTKLREHFWILRSRQLVKKVVKRCVACKKLFGPAATQPFAPLPKKRIMLTRPFDNVGIDFAGPLFYTTNNDENMQKSYMMIITCAAVRAVHLELVTNMTTEGCVMALRRFIARRGAPSSIFSDNAKTFRRAAIELNEVRSTIDDGAIQAFLAERRIKWHFIVERAPWWGGFWERLIRSIKNTLKAVIGRAKLNFEQLRTFLAEAEAIVNDRPITYVSSDPLDLAPISPSKFLSIDYSKSQEKGVASEGSTDIQEIWKNRFKYTSKLFRRWRLEYLQTLRLFHTNTTKRPVALKEGDVVLMFDQAKPRVHWVLAIVQKVFPGRDGRVRSCEIRCGDGNIFRRPIQLLYPLELGPSEDVKN